MTKNKTARGSANFVRLEGCVNELSKERMMLAYVTNYYETRKCQFILC